MKIVLATSGTLGDHLPIVSLARLLSEKGFHTLVACNPIFANIVKSEGIRLIPLGDSSGESEVNSMSISWDQWMHTPQSFALGEASRKRITSTIETLLGILTKDDLLISARNLSFLSVVAKVTQCKWVEVGLNSISMTDCRRYVVDFSKTNAMRHQYECFEQEVREHFLGSSSAYSDPSPSMRLHAVPREFVPNDYPQVDCVTTGFWLSESFHLKDWKPTLQLEKALAISPPPIALVFSSLPLLDPVACLQKHLEIARLLARPLVLVKGWAFGNAAQAKAPALKQLIASDEIIAVEPLPLSWLFPRLSAAFIHGGMGTLAQALNSGCMTVIEPYGNDQFLNARLAIESGLAKAVHPHRIVPNEVAEVLASDLNRARRKLHSSAFNGLQVALDHIIRMIKMK